MRRLATSWVILLLCAVSGFWGLGLVNYSTRSAATKTDWDRGEVTGYWSFAPGLRSFALMDWIKQPGQGALKSSRQRADVLVELLSLRPMDSADWAALAGAHYLLGKSSRSVFDSLEMSSVTGPNEGYIQVQRAAFGIEVWKSLPDASRARVTSDLIGASASPHGSALLRRVLISQPRSTVDEIRNALPSQSRSNGNSDPLPVR